MMQRLSAQNCRTPKQYLKTRSIALITPPSQPRAG